MLKEILTQQDIIKGIIPLHMYITINYKNNYTEDSREILYIL